ncbi:biopolymer transporter ExbD [Serpentinimonas barnesii]|uniref:biopolymer transporter ExbD n=1 Tax=Serpentinimonas barnesii TaxID=1458427 RepID=UPI000497E229|nr:biopolymer transporter ExbD [Serpentinimonas barnesii]
MPAVAARGKGRRTMSQINMVPFIDVMLVLLIIFMVTATLIVPGQIELPGVGQAARQPERFIHIVIDAQGQIELRDSAAAGPAQAVTLEQLPARVLALQAAAPAAAQGAAAAADAAPTPAAAQGAAAAADAAPTPAAAPVLISADRSVRYEAVITAMDALQRAGVARIGLAVQEATP